MRRPSDRQRKRLSASLRKPRQPTSGRRCGPNWRLREPSWKSATRRSRANWRPSEALTRIAQRDLAEALTRAEKLAAKLAAKNAQRARTKKQESAHDEDITTEFKALDELQRDPSLRAPRMGAELGRRIGVSPATGRRLHAKLTAQDRPANRSLSARRISQMSDRVSAHDGPFPCAEWRSHGPRCRLARHARSARPAGPVRRSRDALTPSLPTLITAALPRLARSAS